MEYEVIESDREISSFVICTTCGCLVWDAHAHDEFHNLLARDSVELAAELIEQIRDERDG